MSQKLKVSGPVPPEEVTVARQTYSDPHDQERLLAIGMAQQGGWRIADIAAALGRGTATIGRWVRKFRSGGIPELLKRSHGARQAQFPLPSKKPSKRACCKASGKRQRRFVSFSGRNTAKNSVCLVGTAGLRKSKRAANSRANGMPSKTPSKWKPSSKTW